LDLNPNHALFASAATSADNHHSPFARASEATRNCAPGYSWCPHLYQVPAQHSPCRFTVSTQSSLYVERCNRAFACETISRKAMTSDERDALIALTSDPPRGSKLAAARDFGMDLSLFVSSLELTPTER